MVIALAGAAVALVILPGLTERIGRRLAPKEWTWLCAVALGGGLVLLELGLAARAAPPALRAAGVASLASACERLLGPLLPGGPVASWAAAAAALALPALAAAEYRRGRRVRRRLAADLWLGERRIVAGYEVVVLPVARPFALSFDHHHGRTIVASDGLLAGLAPAHSEAVVRHEVAHLRHRHQRLLILISVVDRTLGWLPGVPRSVAALHLAVERWADEDAARPSSAARLAVRDSLLALAGAAPAAGVAHFGDAKTVAARIAALEAPPPRPPVGRHVLLYFPGSAAGVVAAPTLVSWGNHVHMVVAMSGRCSI